MHPLDKRQIRQRSRKKSILNLLLCRHKLSRETYNLEIDSGLSGGVVRGYFLDSESAHGWICELELERVDTDGRESVFAVLMLLNMWSGIPLNRTSEGDGLANLLN